MTAVSATDKVILIEKLNRLGGELSHLVYSFGVRHRRNPADSKTLPALIAEVRIWQDDLERWLIETRGSLEAQP